jgi:hypothetical protein
MLPLAGFGEMAIGALQVQLDALRAHTRVLFTRLTTSVGSLTRGVPECHSCSSVALAERAGEVFGADRLAILPWRVYIVASVKDGTMEVRWVASTGEDEDVEAVREASLAVGSGGVLPVVGELAEEFRSRDRASSVHATGKGPSVEGSDATEKEGKTVMELFNGKSINIAYTDKTKLAERLIATRMVRRVMCGRMWRWLSANGITNEVSEHKLSLFRCSVVITKYGIPQLLSEVG